MYYKKNKQGQIAVQMLLFSALAVVLVSGFISLAVAFLQLSVRAVNKTQAFAIAEAGIEYYRWHLAHAPTDYTDGTGALGPYAHNYYDKEGKLIGRFTLDITPPPPGSTVVTIESTGRVFADSSITKKIRVKIGIPSLGKFALALNDNVRFGTGTIVYGPIMSNGGIRFDGIAHNVVESAVPSYDDPDHGGQNEFGVHTHRDAVDPLPPAAVPDRPDVFMAGRNFPVPALDFTNITQTLSNIKTQAQASSTYYASSTAFGYEVVFATSGIYSVYRITALTPPPNGCTNTSNESGWGTWSVQSSTLVATATIPTNGVLFFEDDVWVRGQIDNRRVTVGAARFPDNPSTRASITVNSSTLYTNYNASDTIALIAQNNFNVGLFSEDVLRIDAAIIAQNGRIGRYYYAPPNVANNSQRCGDTVIRQKITLYGTLISNLRYGFGYTDLTGYLEREIIYDAGLLFSPPPNFPLFGSEFQIISWEEVQ